MDYPFIGMLQPFAFGYAPPDWILCDGRTLPINQNQALYSLLGINFGGNGTTTFGIPNLTNANLGPLTPTGFGQYYIYAGNGIYPPRS